MYFRNVLREDYVETNEANEASHLSKNLINYFFSKIDYFLNYILCEVRGKA